ncbi:ATPase, T2SS/T4P/T4SS family [Elusimicrobiota bacterium]
MRMGKKVNLDSELLLQELDALIGCDVTVADPPAPALPAEDKPIEQKTREPQAQMPRPGAHLISNTLPEEPTEKQTEKKKILIVDDNEDYVNVIKYYLENNSYEVLEAADGVIGLNTLNWFLPDMILLDFNMPKMNGYEFIEKLRSNFKTKSIPVILFTGAPNRRHLRDLYLDISDFLEKPLSNAKVLEAIKKVLGQSVNNSFKENIINIEEALEPPVNEPPPIDKDKEKEKTKSAPGLFPSLPEVKIPETQEAALKEPVPEAIETDSFADISSFDDDNEKLLEILDDADEKKRQAQEIYQLETLAHKSPVIKQVNQILVNAVNLGASDIHIEPQEKQVLVRIRQNGTLRLLRTWPISGYPQLSARIKVISNLVITERRLPQDGRFKVHIKGKRLEMRVSTLPTIYGEKIVIRLLGSSKLKGSLDQLGFNDRDFKCVEQLLQSPNGLILVTGPTGSGKTTTLYTMINVINRPNINILTAEDPVEYQLDGISQVQILPNIGLNFESALRSFLRQDPDIMLVGEIRDLETAETAIKASVTGHLILSTLHTNSAAATVTRLVHMGVAPYLVAASARLVIAQRLVRTLCPSCKLPSPLPDEYKKMLKEKEIEQLDIVYRGTGCPTCQDTGYSGRQAVFEVMPISSAQMRRMIMGSQDLDLLNDLAVEEGMTPLRQSVIQMVVNGETSLQEAFKTILVE